jgi:Raf kinase inhibitor-like YbhB/YbcL family protein
MEMRRSQGCTAIFWAVGIFMVVLQSVWAAGFTLSSPQLKDGGLMDEEQVFNSFGCSGKNISPELNWNHPPSGTKSFAVTVYDPDAPTGSGWWHWVIFNIPADVRTLPAGAGNTNLTPALKGPVQSMTDFGKPGYGGACPPKGHGQHHYIFSVYALDVASLPLDASATAALVGFHIHRHAIEKAHLTVLYSR